MFCLHSAHKAEALKCAARALTITLAVGLLSPVPAAAPEWWAERGTIQPNASADDYAVANIGQLKYMTNSVVQHLNLAVPGGAGGSLETLLSTWSAIPEGSRNDYTALNQGQLKAVGSVIYSRLNQTDFPATAPWTATHDDDDHYAAANLGMLKNVFSFTLPSSEDSDEDGLPDWWEMAQFGNLNFNGWGDADNDGHTNREEFARATNPTDDASHGGPTNDADEDGLILSDEVLFERNPQRKDHPAVLLQAVSYSYP